MDIDDYDIHSNLVEKFIVNCDKNAFRKMLNMNLNSTNTKIEKQKENNIKRQQFLKSMRTKAPQHPYFHMDNYNKNYNTFKKDEISNFRLDLHHFIQDPEYKNKCMKGNYKWATLKFKQMKTNLAKRRGIPVEDLKMPKIWSNKKNVNVQMNGNTIKNDNNNNSKKHDSKNNKENTKNNYSLNKYAKALKLKRNEEGIKNLLSPKVSTNSRKFNINL